MTDHTRLERIGDEIQRIIGAVLLTEINDPRLKMLSITGVEVSRDLGYAKLFYSSVGSMDQAKTQQALLKATGFFRKRLAEAMDLRIIPKLQFIYDTSLATGQHLSALIDAALAKDKAIDE